jgi:hypothetical protein
LRRIPHSPARKPSSNLRGILKGRERVTTRGVPSRQASPMRRKPSARLPEQELEPDGHHLTTSWTLSWAVRVPVPSRTKAPPLPFARTGWFKISMLSCLGCAVRRAVVHQPSSKPGMAPSHRCRDTQASSDVTPKVKCCRHDPRRPDHSRLNSAHASDSAALRAALEIAQGGRSTA